ncbi:hypothetical protein PENSPDRAFT_752233 [Peniophora sp. CONT]|nr:hypothetical protein PENSPDRAFT_752233 [Peniophora sp. CONT]
MSPPFSGVGLLYLDNLRSTTFTTLLLVALYCVLACAFCVAVYDLLKGGLRSRSNKLNFGAICVLFILTTSYTVASIVELWKGFNDALNAQDDVLVETGDSATLVLIQNLAFSVSVVLGDAIILWRALVIWAWKKSIKYISGFLLLSTTVLWIFEVAFGAQFHGGQGLGLSVVAVPGSLATSLWATSVISWKYWQERRKLSKDIIKVSRRSALENVLAILTESGLVFTLLWAVYFASALIGEVFNQAMADVMVIAAPLYPMLVVILVARQKTPLHNQLTSIESRTVNAQSTESQDFLVEEGYTRDGDIALYDLQKESFT